MDAMGIRTISLHSRTAKVNDRMRMGVVEEGVNSTLYIDYCRVESCPDGGEVWKEPNGAARTCTSNRHCPSTHYCTSVTTWTGTVYQTKSLCCPSKNFVCSQPRDVGVRCSSTRITRYYFNVDSKTCQSFEVGERHVS